MTDTVAKGRHPISVGSDGVRRVGETRVTLDTVLAAFETGATPEQIAQQFPSLRLADIYTVIGHYLDNPDDVAAYLEQRHKSRQIIRDEVERRFDPEGIRNRLLGRSARVE